MKPFESQAVIIVMKSNDNLKVAEIRQRERPSRSVHSWAMLDFYKGK